MSMINNPFFRKSANCSRFDALLSGKQLKTFKIQTIDPKNLSKFWIDGLEKPCLIEKSTGLGIKLPDSSTTLGDIAKIIGTGFPIKIIGVGEQSEIASTIGDYSYYLANRTADHKILNLISLEFSATKLSARVQSPILVREVDWIDKCWPLDRRAKGDYPQVQKYCLCGMAGSYTDFHVDFGGTSVWYHVLRGQKRFYLIEPTTANLKAYEKWTCSKTQDSIFFGDVVGKENCFVVDLLAGQTLLIPGAWIHAVHTPLDSLVFGGNFLHSYNIIRQLQVYGIEQRTNVGKIYRFPHFKFINWLVLCSLLPMARKRLLSTTTTTTTADNTTNTASDSEDEDEDLIALCDSIKSPYVFKQFPYLVKTCQLWLLSLDDEEYTIFTKSAQEVWCDDGQAVVDMWWDILLQLADILSTDITDLKYKKRMRRHVERIRDTKVFDLLNERVVGPAFSDMMSSDYDYDDDDDDDEENEGEDNKNNDKEDNDVGEKIKVVEKNGKIENKIDMITEPKTVINSLPRQNSKENEIKISVFTTDTNTKKTTRSKIIKSDTIDASMSTMKDSNTSTTGSLRIKLKLIESEEKQLKEKMDENENEGYNEMEEEEQEEYEILEEKDEKEEKQETTLRFRLPISSSSSSTTDSRAASSSSSIGTSNTRFNVNLGFSQPSVFKNRMAQQEGLRGVQIGVSKGKGNKAKGLVLSTVKKTAAVSKRKVRKINEYESYEGEEEDSVSAPVSRVNHEFDTMNILPDKEGVGGGRYGTRGKRVSAAFLLHAEDVDIGELRNEEERNEGGMGHSRNKGITNNNATNAVNTSKAASTLGILNIGNNDDIPFMFDDDEMNAPYGEEDWLIDREGRVSEDEERNFDRNNDEGEEDEESDFDGNDEEEERTVGSKRSRESGHVSNMNSTGGSKPLVEKVKRAPKLVTSRQRLLAKFK